MLLAHSFSIRSVSYASCGFAPVGMLVDLLLSVQLLYSRVSVMLAYRDQDAFFAF